MYLVAELAATNLGEDLALISQDPIPYDIERDYCCHSFGIPLKGSGLTVSVLES